MVRYSLNKIASPIGIHISRSSAIIHHLISLVLFAFVEHPKTCYHCSVVHNPMQVAVFIKKFCTLLVHAYHPIFFCFVHTDKTVLNARSSSWLVAQFIFSGVKYLIHWKLIRITLQTWLFITVLYPEITRTVRYMSSWCFVFVFFPVLKSLIQRSLLSQTSTVSMMFSFCPHLL